MAVEEAVLAEVMNLQTEPELLSGSVGGIVPTVGPDIPALHKQLAVLVSTGKAKEVIGVQLTHEQVERLSDKEVEKFTKRYETYVGSKTMESLIDSFIFLVSKAVGMSVKIKDINAYQKELRNDYIINKELSNLAGNLALKCGRFLAAANAVFITTKHIDFSPQLPEQSHPSRDEYAYPLEGVDEVPGSATTKTGRQSSTTAEGLPTNVIN